MITEMDETEKNNKFEFICPIDGIIDQDDVVFLCNKCNTTEVKEVDGVFMCPQCFTEMQPFQCRICESKEVTLHADIGINTKHIHPPHESSEEEFDK